MKDITTLELIRHQRAHWTSYASDGVKMLEYNGLGEFRVLNYNNPSDPIVYNGKDRVEAVRVFNELRGR